MKGSQTEKGSKESWKVELKTACSAKEHTPFPILSTRGRRRLADSAWRHRLFSQNHQEDWQCTPPQKGLGKQHRQGETQHRLSCSSRSGAGLMCSGTVGKEGIFVL